MPLTKTWRRKEGVDKACVLRTVKAMKFKVLLCLSILGQINLGFPSEISVPLGSSTVLPCSYDLPVNDELLNITWSFNGSVIAARNYTEHGFYLNLSAFLNGSCPLTVYNATPHHNGVYQCNVNSNGTKYSSNVTLTILAPPSVFIPSTEVILGRENELECWAKGFSPSNITFLWTREGKKFRATQKSKTYLTDNGLYEALSRLVFIPELSDRNTTFSCVVHHEALKKPLVREFRTNITILPKVTMSIVPSPSRTSPLTLACEINGFYPQNMSMLWVRNGSVLPEYSQIQQNDDGTYRMHRFLTLSVVERNRAGHVQCVAQQPQVSQPVLSSINLSAADLLGQELILTKSAKASVAMMIISLILVLLLCFGLSWKRRDEKQKSLSVSAIILPPKVVIGQKGRVTISIEGRRAEQVQTAWFLNDVPIVDTSSPGVKSYGLGSFRSLGSKISHASLTSETGPLLAAVAPGYYKLHARQPLLSSGPTKQLLSSFTFIPNLSIHKGAAFKCQISYRGKEKIVVEKVSEKFTVLSPPEVSEIQLSEPDKQTGIVTMTIVASHFHPDVITFRWFCKGGELCPVAPLPGQAAPRPDAQGFFSARSQCRLPQAELERGETSVWVTVHHRSLKQPITRKTRGFIKKPTLSEISCSCSPSAPHHGPVTLSCYITGFYPPDIAVKWLKRSKDKEKEVKNLDRVKDVVELWGPIQMEMRTFRATALLKDVENELMEAEEDEEILCRVEHCSLSEPIERVWKNSHFVAPSIPDSLSVIWRTDHVGVFSLCLSGGVPHPKLLWAAGGSTLSNLISRETEKESDKGERELLSVCTLMKSTAEERRDTNPQNHQNGHIDAHIPALQHEAGKELSEREEESHRKMAEETSDSREARNQAGETDVELSCLNKVYVQKEGGAAQREYLRVTVEVTHPALHQPVYRTWTD